METHAVIPVDASTATKQIPGLERVVVPKHDGFVDVDGPALMVVPAEIPPRHVPTSWTTSFNPQEQNQRFAEAFISPRPKERVHAGEFLMAIWRGRILRSGIARLNSAAATQRSLSDETGRARACQQTLQAGSETSFWKPAKNNGRLTNASLRLVWTP